MPRRVAIQLYGHLRSFEDTYRSLFLYVIEPNRAAGIEFDIFVHTWDEFDAKFKMPTQYNRSEAHAGTPLPELVRERMIAAYAPKAYRVEPQIPLTEAQLRTVGEHGYNADYSRAFRNTCHSFCGASQLRRDYARGNGVEYDLVFITRPDILFFRPLLLAPYFDKERCWQFFTEEELNHYVFSPYINGVHSVTHPARYVPGLDLIILARPGVIDKLAEWESVFDGMMDRWPEYALMDMMNRQGLHHAYITYEKDKHWTIWRLGAKQAGFFDKIINRAYLRALPLLLRSRLFRQHTYSNTTTNVSVDEMRAYLWQHLDIHPKRWG